MSKLEVNGGHMIYLTVGASRFGYSLRPSLRGGSPNSPGIDRIINEVGDIASACGLYPQRLVFNIIIPYNMLRQDLSQFCLLAQLEGYHIEMLDFESVDPAHSQGIHNVT
jgi:hypothetical protein